MTAVAIAAGTMPRATTRRSQSSDTTRRSQSFRAVPPIDPGAVVAVGLAALLIVAILAAIAGSSSDTTAREIEAIEQQTLSIREQTAEGDAKIQDIHAYKATLLQQAEEEGRRQADEEWQRRNTHG